MATHHVYKVLCYGDSNKWGIIGKWRDMAVPSCRFDQEHRLPCVLQTALGNGFSVIEEGLGGNTTIYPSPCQERKNDENSLLSCLYRHRPLDLVILMLGINDLRAKKHLTIEQLPVDILRLVGTIQYQPNIGRGCIPPKILLIFPPEIHLAETEGQDHIYDLLSKDIGSNLSLMFPETHSLIAQEKDFFFLNTHSYLNPSPVDGFYSDAASHIRLGNAVASLLTETIFPPLATQGGQYDWQLDGSASHLYMTFDKILPSAQGMDIWENRAYVLYDTGKCAIYDLVSRNAQAIDSFPLGSFNKGTPTRDYLNHANSCMFGNIHHNKNPIPLLYVTIGTGIGADKNGYFYRCAVENIVRTVDSSGTEHHKAQTLQVISYRPNGIEQTSFMQPCWGCPAFFVDTDKSFLYIFSALYRTKHGCIPEGETNQYIITKFHLPALDQGAFVHLTPANILEQFTIASDVFFTQGGTLFKDKIIYTFGCPEAGYPLHIMIFDLKRHKLIAHVGNLDEAFCNEEIECCSHYQGMLLCNTNEGSIYTLEVSLRNSTTQ